MGKEKKLSIWETCERCKLCKSRKTVVMGRGQFPADVLFVGEGPGKAEDTLGTPFVGPAGKLLSSAIDFACKTLDIDEPSMYLTNLVACRPTDRIGGPNRVPKDEECLACHPRIETIYKLVKPKIVVLLGKVPQRFLGKTFPRTYYLEHPAFILRQGGTTSPRFLTYSRNLADIFERIPK